MDKTNQHYYTLNLGHIEIKHSRQSIYRHWNRLTRLQKTLFVISFLLFSVYVLSHIEFHRTTKHSLPKHHEHEPVQNKPIDNYVESDNNNNANNNLQEPEIIKDNKAKNKIRKVRPKVFRGKFK